MILNLFTISPYPVISLLFLDLIAALPCKAHAAADCSSRAQTASLLLTKNQITVGYCDLRITDLRSTMPDSVAIETSLLVKQRPESLSLEQRQGLLQLLHSCVNMKLQQLGQGSDAQSAVYARPMLHQLLPVESLKKVVSRGGHTVCGSSCRRDNGALQ